MNRVRLFIDRSWLLLILFFVFTASCCEADQGKNQRTEVTGITSLQAFDLWKQNRNRVKIIDCRTKEEFASGHPEMAVNIPIVFIIDGSVVQNPDFESEVEKIAHRSDTVLMICRTGRRSLIAALRMLQAGYTDVKNISDGFEGKAPKGLSSGNTGPG